MENNNPQAPGPGLNLADIYYILFRHKWKILLLTAAGCVAAGVYYFMQPHVYSSEAKLLIRYVLDSKLPTGLGGDPQIKTPDPGGENIINSEMEIIRSLDLAEQVVDVVGTDKLVGNGAGDTNRYGAAVLVKNNLLVEMLPRSDIVRIVFQHPNREVVQPVLDALISAYLKKHVEIHRSVGAFDDVLTQQTDQLKSQLAQTEAELHRAITNAALGSFEEARKAYTEEISKIRETLFNTQAELAERQAALQERQKLMPAPVQVATNQAEVAVPAAKVEEYRNLGERLVTYRKHEQELLGQFTEESSMVRTVREQILAAAKLQKELAAQYPKLVQIQPATADAVGSPKDWSDQEAQIKALQAKITVLTNQLAKLNAEAEVLNEREPNIAELQRKKDLEEAKYRHFSQSLEQARFDDQINAGKMSNISPVQAPTPPYRESKRLVKTLSTLVFGGVVAGIALAFILELLLDSTVRRPVEVETRLRLPLFITIPDSGRNGHARRPQLPASVTAESTAVNEQESPREPAAKEPATGGGVVTWHPGDKLGPYYESLRDRLVTFFEIKNLTRKPKLIAVTGCTKGSGVTTIATGLAASLSETGEGNVLLVDMTTGQGAAHPFFKGKPGCGLADALQAEKRDEALVQENLYMVTETSNGEKLHRMLPRLFNSMVPKLKASDYDYIIFDMPAVGQISITPRLAGFMDMVLLVIESEKTDREVVKRATAMLAESKANVGAVLNRNRDYVPKRLSQDI